MKKYHNKLIRDKIPFILQKKKIHGECCFLNDDGEFYNSLVEKLQEEIVEFVESDELQELGDIQDVIDEILQHRNISNVVFNRLRSSKTEKNGGFKERMFLLWTEEERENRTTEKLVKEFIDLTTDILMDDNIPEEFSGDYIDRCSDLIIKYSEALKANH